MANSQLTNLTNQLSSDSRYLIGLSGGIDSVVLLHLFAQIQQVHPIKLEAMHVNHGISPYANGWEHFCQKLCDQFNIPLHIHRVNVTKHGGESLENNARRARYQYFFSSNADTIILAHHENDQIETTLSQIFRGSALNNIAGMKTVTQKQNKLFWRPLLTTKKAEIEAYAKEQKLEYIDDESNADTKFLRNFIRHDILPRLTDFDPHIGNKILHLGHHLQTATSLLDQLAAIDLESTQHNETSQSGASPDNAFDKLTCHAELVSASISKAIDVEKFKQLAPLRQVNLLSYFIRQNNLPLPSEDQLTEFVHQVMTSRIDRNPQLNITATHTIIRRKNSIILA